MRPFKAVSQWRPCAVKPHARFFLEGASVLEAPRRKALFHNNFYKLLAILSLSATNLFAESPFPVRKTIPEVFGIARIKVNNPVSVVPDFATEDKVGWRQAYVFSAQNIVGKKFDLHCCKVDAENLLPMNGLAPEKFVGECLVTGVTSVVISQTPLFDKGFILDCATESDEYARCFNCKMHLFHVNGEKFKIDSFADRANQEKLMADEIVESLFNFHATGNDVVASVLVYAREKSAGHGAPRWSIVELHVDLNKFHKVSERVARTFLRHSFDGGFYLVP